MTRITQLSRVMVPVSDQDEGIAFYTTKLRLSLIADVPYGQGQRWVEVAPPGGGRRLRSCPPRATTSPVA